MALQKEALLVIHKKKRQATVKVACPVFSKLGLINQIPTIFSLGFLPMQPAIFCYLFLKGLKRLRLALCNLCPPGPP